MGTGHSRTDKHGGTGHSGTDKRGGFVYWPFWERQTGWVVYTGHSGTGKQGGLWVLAILGQTDKQSGAHSRLSSGRRRDGSWPWPPPLGA